MSLLSVTNMTQFPKTAYFNVCALVGRKKCLIRIIWKRRLPYNKLLSFSENPHILLSPGKNIPFALKFHQSLLSDRGVRIWKREVTRFTLEIIWISSEETCATMSDAEAAILSGNEISKWVKIIDKKLFSSWVIFENLLISDIWNL